MEVNVSEIKTDLIKELRDESNKEKLENNLPLQIEEDFLDLDIIRALIQLKDGIAIAIISRDVSENAQILITDTIKSDDDSVRRWQRVIQKFIRAKFPQWVDKLKGVQDQDIVILILSDLFKISSAYAIRAEDKDISENPNFIFKFFAYFRKIITPKKAKKELSHGGV